MSYLKFTLALVLVFWATGTVRAWDLGVVTMNKIIIFSNGTSNAIKDVGLKNMRAVAFDPIKKDLFVSDKHKGIGSIYRIKTTGKTAYKVTELIVTNQTSSVVGIAFDYKTSTLYWTTDDYKTIRYVHLTDYEISIPFIGQDLLKFDKEISNSIAIDVCRRYLYWANDEDLTIERSRLDGSGRQVLVHVGTTYATTGIAVDAETNTLYWSNQDSIYKMDPEDKRTEVSIYKLHRNFEIALDDRNMFLINFHRMRVSMMPKNNWSSDSIVSQTDDTFQKYIPLSELYWGLFTSYDGDKCKSNAGS